MTMAMTLYWASGSSFAWTALLALELKGFTYESKMLNMMSGEHKTPAFLQINTRGKVPVLVDGDIVISESLAILAYLDALRPEPSLFGTSPRQKAAIMAALSEQISYLESPSMLIPFTTFFKAWDETSQATIRDAATRVLPEFQRINALLAEQTCVAGEMLSAADLRLFPVLQIIWRANIIIERNGGLAEMAPLQRSQFVHIDRWCQRIEALPCYDSTYPPHWRKN
jgi:glutathione S-transferase